MPGMADLRGQVGIVTGAGRGIGRAVAERLASEGMAVALLARSADELEAARSACEAAGGQAIALVVDVTHPTAVDAAVRAVEADLGPPDLLVSNAGTSGPQAPLWEVGYDAWWRTVQVNLGGALAAAAAVLPGMVSRGGGRIVQINSLVATRDHLDYGAYAVSKAGVLRLGGVLAASLADTGVVVLDVSPGLVRTAMTTEMPMWADVPDSEWTPVEKAAALVAAIAHGRLDRLAGRFVHAEDDWELMATRADDIAAADGRAFRLTPAWPDDPLFS
jgi:NAD(P)-dependent dehydrogenase (short-subunit alcohol dehydrogenase family)